MCAGLIDSFQLVRPCLPDALVSQAALARIERLANRLPFTMQVAFEVRLAEGDSQVDISQLFSPAYGLRQVLTDYARQMCEQEHQVWPLIHEFSEAWSRGDPAMQDAVSLVWLEYDLSGDPLLAIR